MKLLMTVFLQIGLACVCFANDDIPNFHQVENGLYRSGRITEQGLQRIQRDLGIRTIVNIDDSMPHARDEKKWAEQAGIRYESIPLSPFLPPADRRVDEILELINDPTLQPLLIHCLHGEDRTGLIIGLYRVFTEKWTPQAAYQEMLDLGFHPQLVGLDRYYKRRSGFNFEFEFAQAH
jgi:tyrosine-protein phosphatase SIW14